MSEEDYQTPHEENYVQPEVDTLYILLQKGTTKRPMNLLQDIVTQANMHQGVNRNNDLYTWANFKAMIEAEYGSILQVFLDAHPGDVAGALQAWLSDYSAAHNGPTIALDGWEGSGYACPAGEPMAGLLPPAE